MTTSFTPNAEDRKSIWEVGRLPRIWQEAGERLERFKPCSKCEGKSTLCNVCINESLFSIPERNKRILVEIEEKHKNLTWE